MAMETTGMVSQLKMAFADRLVTGQLEGGVNPPKLQEFTNRILLMVRLLSLPVCVLFTVLLRRLSCCSCELN